MTVNTMSLVVEECLYLVEIVFQWITAMEKKNVLWTLEMSIKLSSCRFASKTKLYCVKTTLKVIIIVF